MTLDELLAQLITFTINKEYLEIKELLDSPRETTKEKGDLFELYMQELYEGNGWICRLVGGKDDMGADLLLSHPSNPSQVQHIVQVKNHKKPLNFKDTRNELIQFETIASKKYNCTDYKLISINGYVENVTERKLINSLEKFNICLLDFQYIKSLVDTYKASDQRKDIKPTLTLYAHNELSYKRILHSWNTSNKTCFIQATGSGKSKVILKILGTKFFNEKKLILAPSTYILNQFKNDVDSWVLENTEYMTYAKLNLLSDEYISNLSPSCIILDEFHRVGAEKWGSGVERVLKIHPNAKVLGATATPLRSDSKDMAHLLFDNNIANSFSIHEAILKKILPMPKYISAIYDLSNEIELIKYKIKYCANNESEKKAFLENIEKVNIDWNKCNGLPEILKKHIEQSNSKGIVFCEDKNHLNEMYTLVESWFIKAGFDVKKNRVVSDDSDHNKEFLEFKNSCYRNKIHLLFTINKLNEGVHLKQLDFVIFLRKTQSEIVYLQQLGRVLQADNKDKQPIVFDFVCNFKNINNSFLSDFRSASKDLADSRKRLGLQEDTTVIDTIQLFIHDETRAIVDVFKGIENALITSWEAQYAKLVQYYNEHGDTNVPQSYKDKTFAFWVTTQRRRYKKNDLSSSQIELLEKINFSWDLFEAAWKQKYEALKLYFKENGHSDVPVTFSENNLGTWVATQRAQYKKNVLSNEKIELLQELNFKWYRLNELWHENYLKLFDFFKKEGHSDLSKNYEDAKLARWVNTQRKRYKNNTIDPAEVKLLEEINFKWNKIEEQWFENYEKLKTYYNIHKHTNPPSSYSDKSFLYWIGRQRRFYSLGKLSKEREALLNELNFIWDIKRAAWDEQYEKLKSFYKVNGHCNIQDNYSDKKLLTWVRNQRSKYINNSLSQELIDKLNVIEFVWNPYENNWNTMYKALEIFYREYGHSNPSSDENSRLKVWVRNQRSNYKKGLLSAEKIQLLEKLNFIWDLNELAWNEQYQSLVLYHKQFNHCNVPSNYNDGSLCSWVLSQRSKFKNGMLSQERINLLNKLDFSWAPKDEAFISNYEKLKKFYEIHKHSNVPKNYSDKSLATWVKTRRTAYKKNTLSPEVIELLNKLDFVWDLKEQSWTENYNELKVFYLKNGHSNVSFSSQEHIKLAKWSYAQLRAFRNGTLSESRKQALDLVEFDWKQ